jgi:hypothetical protein
MSAALQLQNSAKADERGNGKRGACSRTSLLE